MIFIQAPCRLYVVTLATGKDYRNFSETGLSRSFVNTQKNQVIDQLSHLIAQHNTNEWTNCI